MCNDYRFRPLSEQPFEEFRQVRIELVFPAGKPNIEPRDDIRIGDSAPVITRSGEDVALTMTKWAWKSPQGRPVFNFRSDGRSFASSVRCVIPADGFYEFTDALPSQKRKTKWLFTRPESPAFWIAGVIRDGAFAMLTTEPGADIAPYHDRQIVLLEQRVSSKAPSTDMQKTVTHLREQLAERNMVGDLRAAEGRLDELSEQVKELEKTEKAEHDAVRAAELAAREEIVAEAESISGQDPSQIQWKTSSARMNELFEGWKTAQKSGVRLGRSNEDALWKRFRAARTVFDRHRRAYFSQLDSNNSAAKSAKEKLIADAEALSSSTDWGYAAGEYRRLMDDWKASPRASRKDDDALWARFRAAQDVFFTNRQAANEEIDQEYAANLTVKEALLVEASAILPVKDLAGAKKALQSVRDRWEEAGKVPRADMGRIEAGLRKVEDAVRHAEEENWQRSNPETKARTNSALSQLEAAIAGLQEDLAKAEKAGDQRKIKAAQEALDARQAWLDQIQRSASEFS